MTAINGKALRDLLLAFDFKRVFQSSGWDTPTRRPFMLNIRDREVSCVPIGEKGGWTVLEITVAGDGSDITEPGERTWRQMVDVAIADQMREHVIVFINSNRSEAVFLFSKTFHIDKRTKTLWRERRLNAGTPIAPLVALLRGMEIPFEMLDDEGEVSVTAMNDRMAQIGLYAERASKRFFDQLAKKRKGFELFLAWVDAEKDRSWYITALLNRLMFIYFIQHKGLMKGDQAYLRHRLDDCIEHGYNFYRDFFLPLCFFGFARPWGERKKYGGHFDGIPYLNGGLFLPHEVEKKHGITPDAVEAGTLPAEVTIPNEQFVAWFDFFDSYRWTLDEENVEYEGHINPDILGYIFEKYINQKQMGAYYTKEDITGYICRNTIIPRLFDMLAATGKKGAQAVNPLPIGPHPNLLNDGNGISGGEGIERYIYTAVKTQEHLPTETDREFLARQQRYESIRQDYEDGKITAINDIITYNLDIERLALDFIAGIQDVEVLRDFYFEGLRKITVLDPTCGSGAFLFAALKVLYPLYAACVKKMVEFHKREAGSAAIAVTWKGEFAFANEVSQQLAFIDTPDDGRQAMLDQFGAELTSIREHDNVEYFIYKRIIVDNLFGVDIMAEAVEICKLRLFLKLIAHADPVPGKDNLGIEPLPDVDFNILCGNTLVGFATHEEARQAVLGKGQTSLQFDDTMDRIEEKARAVDILATAFRQAQTTRNIHATPEQKAALEKALRDLEHELNGYLARQYGITSQKSKAYTKWLESHQPFHWYVEFFGTMVRGGFDAIVGNPPYVEYRTVRGQYRLQDNLYHSEPADNLYAYCIERSCSLLHAHGWFGMIVPAGMMAVDGAVALREVMLEQLPWLACSTYAIRPSKLFDGVDQRLCIFIAGAGATTNSVLYSSRYHHWYSEERPNLFAGLAFHRSYNHPRLHRIPQIGSHEAYGILEKLEESRTTTIASFLSPHSTANLMHYHRSPRYWIRAMDFEQYFSSATHSRSIHHFRNLYFTNARAAKVCGAILNSSLYFFWFLSVGNGRNLTGTDVELFSLGDITDTALDQLLPLFDRLMEDYRFNSFTRTRTDCAFQEFRPSLSKPIIDEIDRVLARHYGFTDEESDFIINYDIKYRMGRDTDGEE